MRPTAHAGGAVAILILASGLSIGLAGVVKRITTRTTNTLVVEASGARPITSRAHVVDRWYVHSPMPTPGQRRKLGPSYVWQAKLKAHATIGRVDGPKRIGGRYGGAVGGAIVTLAPASGIALGFGVVERLTTTYTEARTLSAAAGDARLIRSIAHLVDRSYDVAPNELRLFGR